MTMFSVRLADDLAARFDAAAGPLGGRSALLRRVISVAALPAAAAPPELKEPRSAARVMVRLAAADIAAVDREAAAMGLSRAAWISGLVRRHARGRPCFGRASELSLMAIQSELRRIGVNINQIARALNTAVMEGRVLALELGDLADLRKELRGHMSGVGEASVGNLAYWDIAP